MAKGIIQSREKFEWVRWMLDNMRLISVCLTFFDVVARIVVTAAAAAEWPACCGSRHISPDVPEHDFSLGGDHITFHHQLFHIHSYNLNNILNMLSQLKIW